MEVLLWCDQSHLCLTYALLRISKMEMLLWCDQFCFAEISLVKWEYSCGERK